MVQCHCGIKKEMKQAKYKVVANGSDITAAIHSRLLRLEITDNSGVDSDALVIELDNREGKVKLPETGAELKVWLGFDDNLIFKGIYEVDELEVPLDDDVFTIHAKAIKMKGSLKAPQDFTYDDITFGALVDKVANRHGYESKVASGLSSIVFPHIDQKSESYLNLLTRLARENGGFFKPVADKLVIH
jgi:phage protein D